MELSEIQTTIAEQIGAKELKYAKFILMADESKPKQVDIVKGKKGMTIIYDIGSDTYTIKQHKIKGLGMVKTEVIKDRLWEDLRPMISDFFKFEYVFNRLGVIYE